MIEGFQLLGFSEDKNKIDSDLKKNYHNNRINKETKNDTIFLKKNNEILKKNDET